MYVVHVFGEELFVFLRGIVANVLEDWAAVDVLEGELLTLG